MADPQSTDFMKRILMATQGESISSGSANRPSNVDVNIPEPDIKQDMKNILSKFNQVSIPKYDAPVKPQSSFLSDIINDYDAPIQDDVYVVVKLSRSKTKLYDVLKSGIIIHKDLILFEIAHLLMMSEKGEFDLLTKNELLKISESYNSILVDAANIKRSLSESSSQYKSKIDRASKIVAELKKYI